MALDQVILIGGDKPSMSLDDLKTAIADGIEDGFDSEYQTATDVTTAINAAIAGLQTEGEITVAASGPATAGATGTKGQIVFTAEHIYVCVDTDTWKRVAIATWSE